MLDVAVGLVLTGHHVACFAEWETGAASILLARMADEVLEPAPIWCGDIAGLDLRHLRGLVDVLSAGLPCQPYSQAGKRVGNSDSRSWGSHGAGVLPELGDGSAGPMPHALRIIAECRPAVVFLENVPAWVRSGWFRPFGEELCRLGYDIAEPVFIAAGDVGASHERERVFVLAYASGNDGERRRVARVVERAERSKYGEGDEWQWDGDASSDRGAEVGNSRLQHFDEEQRAQRVHESAGTDFAVADAGCRRRSRPRGGEDEQPRRAEAERTGEDVGDAESDDERRNPIAAVHGEWESSGGSGGAVGHTYGIGEQQSYDESRAIAREDAWERAGGTGGDLADTSGIGRGEGRPESGRFEGGSDAVERGSEMEHSHRRGFGSQSHRNIAEWEHSSGPGIGIFAPGPQCDDWGGIIADRPDLAPAIEPGLRVLVDGVAYVVDESRPDQLRCSGNGVVPLQAAMALATLLQRVGRRVA